MGSKRSMLRNGLGELLLTEARSRPRFVDLFAGSGAVAAFVASQVRVPVIACDLQNYSRVLSAATLSRTKAVDVDREWKNWRARAKRAVVASLVGSPAIPDLRQLSWKEVSAVRTWCSDAKGPITRAYGGHYFSPRQALWIDALRQTVAGDERLSVTQLAALIDAASECAAAPGHTAQPFQPTKTARKFLRDAWRKDVLAKTHEAFERIGGQFSKRKGMAVVCDANEAAKKLVRERDLVFLDPPYSALQYSRFYHVLEGIVSGEFGQVEGVGRYPNAKFRPQSAYSVKSKAIGAMDQLLQTLAKNGADVVITFPLHVCSNGLSGALIRALSEKHFDVSQTAVKSRFSTLGGSGPDCIASEKRGARRDTSELMLLLRAR